MSLSYRVALLASLALFAASLQWLLLSAYVWPRDAAARELAVLTETLRAENARRVARPAEQRGASISDLLARVQQMATADGVDVNAIQPVPGGDDSGFSLMLQARYDNLLRFLAKFETLQATITGFEIAPAIDRAGQLTASLSFRHSAAASAEPRRAEAFVEALRGKLLRDPFDPSATPLTDGADPVGNDLTWSLNLTSISEIGNSRFATIDGKDYGIGDNLQGRTIAEIGEDRVTLVATQGGESQAFVLRFRNPVPKDT